MSDIINIIQIVVSILAFLGLGYELFLLTKQIKDSNRLNAENKQWNQISESFKVAEQYSGVVQTLDSELLKELNTLQMSPNFESTIQHTNELIKNEKYRKDIYLLIRFFESLCLGIEKRYFDEHVLKQQFSQVLMSNYNNLRAYIHIRRVETKNNEICCHFEAVANRWSGK